MEPIVSFDVTPETVLVPTCLGVQRPGLASNISFPHCRVSNVPSVTATRKKVSPSIFRPSVPRSDVVLVEPVILSLDHFGEVAF